MHSECLCVCEWTRNFLKHFCACNKILHSNECNARATLSWFFWVHPFKRRTNIYHAINMKFLVSSLPLKQTYKVVRMSFFLSFFLSFLRSESPFSCFLLSSVLSDGRTDVETKTKSTFSPSRAFASSFSCVAVFLASSHLAPPPTHTHKTLCIPAGWVELNVGPVLQSKVSAVLTPDAARLRSPKPGLPSTPAIFRKPKITPASARLLVEGKSDIIIGSTL